MRRSDRLQAIPARSAGPSARVLAFPQQQDIRRHLDHLQVLSLIEPKAAKAILKMTERAAAAARQAQTG